MEFNDEQMAAINDMIAAKVSEATTELTGQITSLKNQNEALIGEKRTATQKAQDAEAEAARERLEKSGSVDAYKARVTELENEIAESRKAIAERDFEESVRGALAKHKIRQDGQTDFFDLIKLRAKHEDGQTMVGIVPIDQYLSDYLNSDSGRHWLAASGSSGSGAPGSTSHSRSPTMTRENFNMTDFMARPKGERDVIADSLGMPHLKNL